MEEKNINTSEEIKAEELIEAVEDTVAEAEIEAAEASSEQPLGSAYTEFEISGLTPAQRRRREIYDKITTGILILLMASPLLILLYIFLWFVLR